MPSETLFQETKRYVRLDARDMALLHAFGTRKSSEQEMLEATRVVSDEIKRNRFSPPARSWRQPPARAKSWSCVTRQPRSSSFPSDGAKLTQVLRNTIDVTSRPGRTSFRIALPLEQGAGVMVT